MSTTLARRSPSAGEDLAHFADALREMLDLEPFYVMAGRSGRHMGVLPYVTQEEREARRFSVPSAFWPSAWDAEESLPATVRTRGYDHFGRR